MAYQEKEHSPQEKHLSHESAEAVSKDHPTGPKIHEIEGLVVIGMDEDDLEFFHNFPQEQRSKLTRKIDIRLIPMFALLYLISHLDRANIGNAKIEGMDTDLGLSGVQYNTCLSVFFISYIIFEIPSNIILKQIKRPSWYIGGLMITFGIIMCMHGVVKDFTGLALCRFLLGIFEAGFFPGAIFLTSAWYMPRELSYRLGAFFSTGAISGAFSGLLAAGIAQMDGVGGYEGWRWIFILEGLMTVVMGIIAILFMIDLPSGSTSWLNSSELRYLEIQRLMKQGGLANGADAEGGDLGFRWVDLKMVVTNWKYWILLLCLFCHSVAFYGVKFNLPTITASMGFTTTNAQLLSAPPYIVAGVASILIPRLSDHFKRRGPFLVGCFSAAVIGSAVVMAFQGNYRNASQIVPSYLFICVACAGIFPACPIITAWANNNTAPAGRRAMVTAFLISLSNIGGIVGSFIFLSNEAPAYNTGYGVTLAVSFLGFAGAGLLWYEWQKLNKKRRLVDEDQVRAKYTDLELLQMGDRSPLFKYQT